MQGRACYVPQMSDSGGPEPTGRDSTEQDPTNEDLTGLSDEQLVDVVGGSSIFDTGWPQCSTCGKKHDPADWGACTR